MVEHELIRGGVILHDIFNLGYTWMIEETIRELCLTGFRKMRGNIHKKMLLKMSAISHLLLTKVLSSMRLISLV